MQNNYTVKKNVYSLAEGDKGIKNILVGKGFNLSEMTKMGRPVSFGFTVLINTTCNQFFSDDHELNPVATDQIDKSLANHQGLIQKTVGFSPCLLISVRSGSVQSMTSISDTILNLGLNDHTVQLLMDEIRSESFAMDCSCRFIERYFNIVLGIPMKTFQDFLNNFCQQKQLPSVDKISKEILPEDAFLYKRIVCNYAVELFDQDLKKLLTAAIKSIFNTWNNEKERNVKPHFNFGVGDEQGRGQAFISFLTQLEN